MSNIQVSQDFQSRLYEKIRADIGSLMTDDELKALVQSAFSKTFFEDRVQRDSYGHERSRQPSELKALVRELLEPQVRAAVKDWLNEHQSEVDTALREALGDGLGKAVLRSFEGMLQNSFSSLQYNLQQTLQQALQSR